MIFWVGGGIMLITFVTLYFVEETFARDLDFYEHWKAFNIDAEKYSLTKMFTRLMQYTFANKDIYLYH